MEFARLHQCTLDGARHLRLSIGSNSCPITALCRPVAAVRPPSGPRPDTPYRPMSAGTGTYMCTVARLVRWLRMMGLSAPSHSWSQYRAAWCAESANGNLQTLLSTISLLPVVVSTLCTSSLPASEQRSNRALGTSLQQRCGEYEGLRMAGSLTSLIFTEVVSHQVDATINATR